MENTTETSIPFTEQTYKSLSEFRDCFEPREKTKSTQINTKGVEDEEFYKNVAGNLKGVGYFR